MTPSLTQALGLFFQAHPWHGVSPGTDSPEEVTAFIEIVPTDAVKYELDKPSGQLRIDRPQRYSSFSPTLYGFIPQTYCAERVGKRAMERTGLSAIKGDGDPIDICVLSEKPFTMGNFLVRARPIGGLRMIDGHEADDKIIAVLADDAVYGSARDMADIPHLLIDRLRHYFLTYKEMPAESHRRVTIPEVYDRAEAMRVINCSMEDYRTHFGHPERRLSELRDLLTEEG